VKVEFYCSGVRIIGWLSKGLIPVPRVGDTVDLDGKEYEVLSVKWICMTRADIQVVKVNA